jgi:hypothetical protein
MEKIKINWNTVAKVSAVGLGAYVFGQMILYKASVNSMDYWAVNAYLTGLIRGSGSKAQALANVNQWRDYWLSKSGWASFLIDMHYDQAIKGINEIYA